MNAKTKMEKLINQGYQNMAGMIVLKKGEEVYHQYYNGGTPDSSSHVFSVTKSILSMLYGVLSEETGLFDVNQKVLDFFPDYQIKKGEKVIQEITIADLMSMSTPYKYKTEPYIEYFKSDDWVRASLDYMGGQEKTGEFRYTPFIGPDVISAILEKLTGGTALEYANQHLFEPLGIKAKQEILLPDQETHMEFHHTKECSGWVVGPSGVQTGGWGLCMTTPDMAKLGQLYMEEGVCDGKRILSKEWIRISTEQHNHWKQYDYGYLWWLINADKRIYAAIGDAGNVIYVNETAELVIAIRSYYVTKAKDIIKLVTDYIEPVF